VVVVAARLSGDERRDQMAPIRLSLALGGSAGDGRFLANASPIGKPGSVAANQQIIVAQHWFDELKARVPARPSP
jgi:hypothetical protein